jgi:hypothetical protein
VLAASSEAIIHIAMLSFSVGGLLASGDHFPRTAAQHLGRCHKRHAAFTDRNQPETMVIGSSRANAGT